MSTKTKILDSIGISQKIKRLAWEIYENNLQEKEIIFVGVSGRGEVLAKHLSEEFNEISSIRTKIGTISLDKDNPYQKEIVTTLDELEYSNKVVVLIDDVLNSGKTLMYAAKHFLTTPLLKLSTVVLVDRTHNRFPIKADYVGQSIATTLKEYVNVKLDGEEQGIYLS